MLAKLNHQLIADEGHRNSMDVGQLEQRMRVWLASDYRAVVFERGGEVVAYALFRNDGNDAMYLRQFFVVRRRRRTTIGRQAMQQLRAEVCPRAKRIVVEVLTGNESGKAFWAAMGFREYALTLELLHDEGMS